MKATSHQHLPCANSMLQLSPHIMRPAGIPGAHLEVDTLGIKTLVDVRQAALNDADCLFKLHAGAQRARRDQAGQRAERLPVQPGAAQAAAQPLQVGLQLRNESALTVLTCKQKLSEAMRKTEHRILEQDSRPSMRSA